MKQSRVIYVIMFPLSKKLEDFKSITLNEEDLINTIQKYYDESLSSEEIFYRENNLIVTESGYYFALPDGLVTVIN